MKKLIALALIGAMTMSLLSGCGSSGKATDTAATASNVSSDAKLSVCIASEPDHLDPALNATVDGAALAVNSFVGLYTYNEAGEVVPALAADMKESDDGLEFTFTLKDDLKWSDGSDLTAKDFEYAWKRAADPQTAADYSYLMSVFAEGADGTIDVKASDDGKTLTCKLAAPCPYFMNLLAFPVFMPVKQEAVEAASDWQTNPGSWCSEAGFVSNGAFTLAEWNHNESMRYVKNPYFYDAENVKIEELDYMLSADDSAKLAAYNAGDIDYVYPLPNDELANLKENEEFHVDPQIGTYYVTFNVNSPIFEGKTPEQASSMRKALGYLIDRQTVVDNIAQTEQQPANTFIPDAMSDGNGGKFKTNDGDYTYPDEASAGYYPLEVNVDKAVELLKEAGFEFDDNNMLSSSTPIHLNYLSNDTTLHLAVAQQLQQDFAQIGVTMDIQTEDWQTFVNDRNNGNYDVCRGGWVADYDDPINMLEMFVPNENDSGNDHPRLGFEPKEYAPDWTEYMDLIKEIKADSDYADREAKMHKAEDMLMDTGAVAPIYFYNVAYMQKANVTGVYQNVFGTIYFLYASKS